MLAPKPRRLAVIDGFVGVVKRVPSVRGAEHDVPFEFRARQMPFAYVYDTDESYELGSIHGQSDNTLSIEVAVAFEWSEAPNRTPRVIGNRILAELLREVAKDRKLGGVARDTQPTGSTIREIETDVEARLAVVAVQFSVSYHYPQTDPFVAE